MANAIDFVRRLANTGVYFMGEMCDFCSAWYNKQDVETRRFISMLGVAAFSIFGWIFTALAIIQFG